MFFLSRFTTQTVVKLTHWEQWCAPFGNSLRDPRPSTLLSVLVLDGEQLLQGGQPRIGVTVASFLTSDGSGPDQTESELRQAHDGVESGASVMHEGVVKKGDESSSTSNVSRGGGLSNVHGGGRTGNPTALVFALCDISTHYG